MREGWSLSGRACAPPSAPKPSTHTTQLCCYLPSELLTNNRFYNPSIQNNPGEPVLSQRRDLLEQPLDVLPATQSIVSKQYRKTQWFGRLLFYRHDITSNNRIKTLKEAIRAYNWLMFCWLTVSAKYVPDKSTIALAILSRHIITASAFGVTVTKYVSKYHSKLTRWRQSHGLMYPIYTVSKKTATFFYRITLSNVEQSQ